MHARGDTTGQDRPEIEPGQGWSELGKQALVIAFGVFIYFGVRGQTEGSRSAALENGERVLDFERTLGIDWELGLQAIVTPSVWLTTASNWAYIWLHCPLIVLSLVWLHRQKRFHYLLLRNAMFVSGLIGMVFFARFPVAPPRMLPGFVDTVTELSSSYRVLQPPDLVNKYAAVPSLHVGWNLLVGIVLYQVASNRLVRLLASLGPAVMTFAVVATANHYLVDAVLGALVALVGLAVAVKFTAPLAMGTYPHLRLGHHAEIVDDEASDAQASEAHDQADFVGRPGVNLTPGKQSADDPG